MYNEPDYYTNFMYSVQFTTNLNATLTVCTVYSVQLS